MNLRVIILLISGRLCAVGNLPIEPDSHYDLSPFFIELKGKEHSEETRSEERHGLFLLRMIH